MFEIVRREIAAATAMGYKLTLDTMFLVRYLPNSKIDLNSGSWTVQNHSGGYFPFSTDLPFLQHDWPLGDPSTRTRVFDEHKRWTSGLLHYLGTDSEIAKMQPSLIETVGAYGLCADEYPEQADHWTPQLYVRESVRLVGARVLTQQDICTFQPNPTSVGLSQWGVDIHVVKRVAYYNETSRAWTVQNIGGRDTMRTHDGCNIVIEVPYEAITPSHDDTSNLLVPVCASFTHVAFATFRLEPQYAIFGQSAGVAAAMAVRGARSVQAVNVTELQAVLTSQGQWLHANSSRPPSPSPQKQTWGCSSELGRCVGLTSGGGHFPNATCDSQCPQLKPNEWLAQTCCGIWTAPSPTTGIITSTKSTVLKKSTADSSTLPPSETLDVDAGFKCQIVSGTSKLDTYAMCTPVALPL
jgi:hypothetical protein